MQDKFKSLFVEFRSIKFILFFIIANCLLLQTLIVELHLRILIYLQIRPNLNFQLHRDERGGLRCYLNDFATSLILYRPGLRGVVGGL